MSETTRMAELTMELIGAKATAEFVREAWASMPADARADFAKAVTSVIIERLKTDNSLNSQLYRHMEFVLDAAIQRAVTEGTNSACAHITTEAANLAKRWIEARLEASVEARMEGVVASVMTTVREKLR